LKLEFTAWVQLVLKTVLDTPHFKCEVYEEVLFRPYSYRDTAQKTLELQFLIIVITGLYVVIKQFFIEAQKNSKDLLIA
jgi:hypothetical protein